MTKTANALKRLLETVWLIVAIIAIGIAIKESIGMGIKNSLMYYLFGAIAFFFYFSRRRERLKK